MLHYTLRGSEQAPTVVLLHGFMGTAADWAPIIEHLAPAYRVLAVDLPGHGGSLQQPEAAYTMGGAAHALEDVLNEAGVARCALVGYSMGGRVALHHALHHPHRLHGLVLESASPGLETEAARRERKKVDAGRAWHIQTDFLGFLEHWYRIPLFASLERHDLVERMIEQRIHNDPAELARVLAGLGTGQQPSFWERLPELRMPTLVLAGAWDEKYVALTERMEDLSDRICRTVVPDAGHNIHAERPGVYAEHLQRFLESAV